MRSYAPWHVAFHDSRHSSAATVDGPVTGRIAWRRELEGPVVRKQPRVAVAATMNDVLDMEIDRSSRLPCPDIDRDGGLRPPSAGMADPVLVGALKGCSQDVDGRG